MSSDLLESVVGKDSQNLVKKSVRAVSFVFCLGGREWCLFCLGATPGDAYCLLLVLRSGVIPGGVWRTIWVTRN